MSRIQEGAFSNFAYGTIEVGGTVVSSGFQLGGLISTLFSFGLLFAAAIVITLLSWPWVQYHDEFIERAEHFHRTTIKPLWRDDVRDFFDIGRQIWNATICWWNGAGQWFMGIFREVLFPTIRTCGVKPFFRSIFPLIKFIAQDLVVFTVSGGWLNGYVSFARIGPAGITLFQEWITLYTCTCSDLGDVVSKIPVASPLLAVPPLWPVTLFSGQWTFPETWAALENGTNVLFALARQAVELASQVLNFLVGNVAPGQVFKRPDLRDATNFAVEAVRYAVRSTERAYQVIWDSYVPFDLDWTNFLGVIDQAFAAGLKGIVLVFHTLLFTDRVINFPADPYLESVVKPEFIEVLNLVAEPTKFTPIQVPAAPAAPRFFITTYHLDPASQSTTDGKPNPLFGRMRFQQGVCTFVNRIICDPAGSGGLCFSTNTQHLFFGFDFCCVTTDALGGIVDVLSGLFEFFVQIFKGLDNFIFTIDAQPFTTFSKDGIVQLAKCLLSILKLIPAVGTALRDVLVALLATVASLGDFTIRLGIGLATLPYYLIVNPGVNNFITEPNRALNMWEKIWSDVVAERVDSVKNTLCILINNGFPIPPIPCSECNVGGFIPPTAKRDYMFDHKTGRTLGPYDMYRKEWGIPDDSEDEGQYHITPIIYYQNHTMHPFELANRLWVNIKTLDKNVLPFHNLKSVDEFIDKRKHESFLKWQKTKTCNIKADEQRALEFTNPRLYQYKLLKGDLERERASCADAGTTPEWNNTLPPLISHASRATLGPLEPTLATCNPKPRCFDLCCLPRSILELAAHIIQMLGRFFNGLIQNQAAVQGTLQDFPYFTGEFAGQGKATFDSDVIRLVLLFFRPIKCLCQVINLLLPVQPVAFTAGRPDLCCFIQRLSELIACAIQVLINAINSIAMGDTTNYAYFRTGLFKNDVNFLFDINLEVVRCFCLFVRSTFPLTLIPGFSDAVDFDICCPAEVLLNTITEIIRGIVQVIITLATLTIDNTSYCYWRLDQTADHQCGGTLDELGVIKQADRILDTFFPVHTLGNTGFWRILPDNTRIWISDSNPTSSGGACYDNCNIDNGANGIVPCICQLFNTLIPFRRFPDRKVNCDADPATRNCQQLDLCCAFGKIGFFLSDLTKFTTRFFAAAWQPWSNGLPEFLVAYVWCVEPHVNPCPQNKVIDITSCEKQVNVRIPECPGTRPVLDANNMVQHRCGAYTCGKMNIVIANLVDPFNGLFSKCLCELVGLLDILIALLFNYLQFFVPQAFWACCFCGGFDVESGLCNVRKVQPCYDGTFSSGRPDGSRVLNGSGVLPAVSYIVNAILVALTRLARGFPFPCYWKPYYNPDNPVPQIVAETWIFSFLAPTANAISIAVGNTMCFAQSFFLLPNVCLGRGVRFLGSITRWVFEVVFRVIGFVEAFVAVLIGIPNTCVGPTCDQKPGSKVQETKGVNAKALGNMLVILLSIPIDLLIGDSQIACSTVCRRLTSTPRPSECECWNQSPAYAGGIFPPLYEWKFTGNLTNATIAECPYYPNPSNLTNVEHVGTRFGTDFGCCKQNRNVTGLQLRTALPLCQNPDDAFSQNLEFRPQGGFVRIVDQVGRVTYEPPGYPGSCVVFAACRADALPSIADDPMTPSGLSRLYRGSIDGLVMAFVRYLRCLLDHLFTCPFQGGPPCNSQAQFGIIFYPAILIFSISWQILGGVIRFIASIGIFFFSLFQPPSGSLCGCYTASEEDVFGFMGTQYWRPTGSLCYRCRTQRHDCNTPVPYENRINDPSLALSYRCRDYCPAMQLLRNSTLTPSEAYAKCLADYNDAEKFNPLWKPEEVCSGHYSFPSPYRNSSEQIIQYEISPNYPFYQITQPHPNITNTGTSAGFGWCNPLGGPGQLCCFNCTSIIPRCTDVARYIQLDMCPDPTCQDPNQRATVGGSPLAGFWPCGQGGSSVFDTVYPANPQITCGALTIVNNALGVFNAFVDIFTTPIFIPPNTAYNPETGKRDAHNNTYHGHATGSTIWTYFEHGRNMLEVVQNIRSEPAPRIGPKRREPRQVWSARLKQAQSYKRWDGVVTGLQVEAPSFVEQLSEAMWEYDASDCYTDPIHCTCRNLPMASHCYVDSNTNQLRFHKRYQHRQDGAMTTADMTHVLATEMFTSTTVCDNTIAQHNGTAWADIPEVSKNQWVKCVERLIQGSRMNEVSDVIPVDIMYNEQAPLKLIRNVMGSARVKVQETQTSKRRRESETASSRFHGRFPNWQKKLEDRAAVARRVLTEELGIFPHDLMFDAMVKADELHYKYMTGFYGFLLEEGAAAIMEGRSMMPTTADAANEVLIASRELTQVIMNQPYSEVISATADAGSALLQATKRAFEFGPMSHVRYYWNMHKEYREKRVGPAHRKRMQEIWDSIESSPMYRWWYDIQAPFHGKNTTFVATQRQSIFAPFLNHLRAVIQHNRAHWQSTFAVWNSDLHWVSLNDVLVNRWKNPQWKPHHIENWHRLTSVYHRVNDFIWPGSVSEENRKRFLYNSSCTLIDKTLDITMRVVDYCANEAVVNVRATQDPRLSGIVSYLRETSRYRENGFHHHSRDGKYHYVQRTTDENSWYRPRMIPSQERTLYHHYRRSAPMEVHGPGGWNFYDYLTVFIQDVTNWMLGAQSNSWFNEFKIWLLNPNTAIEQYPDVGLAYWLRFEFTCHFPQSLNCSIGVGFEWGFVYTLVVFLGIAVLGAYILPPITIPLQVLTYPLAAAAIFGAIAYHWSLWCMINLSLPMCLADDLMAFLDKWLLNCLSPLLIPTYMIAGEVCPADPAQFIDFISCKDIGVSDGFQNILFGFYWLFGAGSITFVLQIYTLLVGWWFPASYTVLESTLNAFALANHTNMQRMQLCFFLTILSSVGPLVALLFTGIVLASVVPIGINLLRSFVTLFQATPAAPYGSDFYTEPGETTTETTVIQDVGRRLLSGEPLATKKNQ